MATPGRSRPVRPTSPDAAAFRARLATMTYSFAQQIPPLPPRPSHPPNPPPRPISDDPNFPHLSSTPSPNPPHQQPWVSPPGKPTTAAEIVAARKPHIVTHYQQTEENAKQQAELALYSKLVPTTSAVPRNPGRPMGSGGLRATGSVAAQKPRPVPQTQNSLVQRKEPLASRMRSLSSEASRPQLARRVAKSSRTPATPPSAENLANPSVSPSKSSLEKDSKVETTVVPETPDALSSALDVKAASISSVTTETNATSIAAPMPRDFRKESRDAFLKSIASIYGNVDKDPPRSASRTEPNVRRSAGGGEARQTGGEPISVHRSKNSQPPVRRLEEAFSNAGRYDGVRSPSPVAMRKSQIGALRRPSVSSPPPASSTSRNMAVREHPASKDKNGGKIVAHDSTSDVPPGFEGRASTASRASFVSRRSENDGSGGGKPVERESAPALPQNDRADAFREAINTRRHSSSPRPSLFRRVSSGESSLDGSQQPTVLRVSSDKDGMRPGSGSKGHLRKVSLPPKQTASPPTNINEQMVREKRKSEHGISRIKREEKIFERRMERSNESHSKLEVQHHSKSNPGDVYETSSSTNVILGVNDIHISLPNDGSLINNHIDVGQLIPSSVSSHDFRLGSEADKVPRHPTCGIEGKVTGFTSGIGAEKSEFDHHHLNGWTTEANGVHGDDLLTVLLDQQEDPYMASIPGSIRSTPLETDAMEGTSMIDLMRQLHSNSSMSTVLSNERIEDVLPPLPNSEEDVRFESVLRSMGWTPPEEDETARGNGMGVIRETTSRALQAGVGDIGLNSIRSVENGNGQSPFYSHFP